MLIALFLAGAALGSFAVTLGLRVAVRKTILGRSQCDSCSHNLWVRDLVPILGAVRQHFRCRHCGKPISPLYPALELTSGVAFVLVGQKYGATASTVTFCVAVTLLLAIAVADWAYMLVPNILVAPLFVVGLVSTTPYGLKGFLLALGGGLLGFGVFLVIAGIKRGGVGAGDAKLAAALGVLLGFPRVVLGFELAFLMALGWALCLLDRRRATFRSPIPMGTFLVIGATLALVI